MSPKFSVGYIVRNPLSAGWLMGMKVPERVARVWVEEVGPHRRIALLEDTPEKSVPEVNQDVWEDLTAVLIHDDGLNTFAIYRRLGEYWLIQFKN